MSLKVPEIRSLESFLDDALYTAFHDYQSFALWYDAENHQQVLLLTNSARPWNINESLENSLPGFILHPYNTEKHQAFFLPAEKLIRYNPLTFSIEEGEELLKECEASDWKANLKQKKNTEVSDQYYSIVEKGIAEIEKGTFKKVVVARKKFHPYTNQTDSLAVLYKNVRQAYPTAFVSLFFHPEVGCWISATPELLVKQKGQETFHTVALAGTQAVLDNSDNRKVSWTQKEIEEQALVNRYIINCFKTIRLREYEEDGPRTVQAGRLLHLRTEFTVNLKEVNHPDLASTMLRLLHPTSAVCGMPLNETRNFLNQFEDLDRSYFSGFIGPVNIGNYTQLNVHLRCAELTQDGAWLYAGAGITQDSIIDNEWNETELKMDVIGRYL